MIARLEENKAALVVAADDALNRAIDDVFEAGFEQGFSEAEIIDIITERTGKIVFEVLGETA